MVSGYRAWASVQNHAGSRISFWAPPPKQSLSTCSGTLDSVMASLLSTLISRDDVIAGHPTIVRCHTTQNCSRELYLVIGLLCLQPFWISFRIQWANVTLHKKNGISLAETKRAEIQEHCSKSIWQRSCLNSGAIICFNAYDREQNSIPIPTHAFLSSSPCKCMTSDGNRPVWVYMNLSSQTESRRWRWDVIWSSWGMCGQEWLVRPHGPVL